MLGTIFAVALIEVWAYSRRTEQKLSVIKLVGTIVSSRTYVTLLAGVIALLLVGSCYGIFTFGVIYAFNIDTLVWLFGAGIAILLWILTGITLTYFSLLHPKVRRGEIKAPGPFAINYSREAAIALLIGHVLFGSVCVAAYSWLA